ncbi:MAG: hypothetical protein U5J83_03525 [Bryobacterales bacterium]|nr:hypothetical protein [Bryobacterales bacterium]
MYMGREAQVAKTVRLTGGVRGVADVEEADGLAVGGEEEGDAVFAVLEVQLLDAAGVALGLGLVVLSNGGRALGCTADAMRGDGLGGDSGV